MTDERIQIPDGMFEAVKAVDDGVDPLGIWIKPRLEAALRWLSENPVCLSGKVLDDISSELPPHRFLKDYGWLQISNAIQRRMFLAPEPEVPEEIADLMLVEIEEGFFKPSALNQRLVEAYKRGKAAK